MFAKGVPIIKDPDQYATDLMKCISAIRDREQASLGDDKAGVHVLPALQCNTYICHSSQLFSSAVFREDWTRLCIRFRISTRYARNAVRYSLSRRTTLHGS